MRKKRSWKTIGGTTQHFSGASRFAIASDRASVRLWLRECWSSGVCGGVAVVAAATAAATIEYNRTARPKQQQNGWIRYCSTLVGWSSGFFAANENVLLGKWSTLSAWWSFNDWGWLDGESANSWWETVYGVTLYVGMNRFGGRMDDYCGEILFLIN